MTSWLLAVVAFAGLGPVLACETRPPEDTADADAGPDFEPIEEPVIVDYTTCGVTRQNPATVVDDNGDCPLALTTVANNAEVVRQDHASCDDDDDCAIVTFGHGCGDSIATAVGIGRCDAVNVDEACDFLAALEAQETTLCANAFPAGCTENHPCTTTEARCEAGICVGVEG